MGDLEKWTYVTTCKFVVWTSWKIMARAESVDCKYMSQNNNFQAMLACKLKCVSMGSKLEI